jgi:hypothetical protein
VHVVAVRVVEEFSLHDSMAYGLDWAAPIYSGGQGGNAIASCSFYDCRLNVWSSRVAASGC